MCGAYDIMCGVHVSDYNPYGVVGSEIIAIYFIKSCCLMMVLFL